MIKWSRKRQPDPEPEPADPSIIPSPPGGGMTIKICDVTDLFVHFEARNAFTSSRAALSIDQLTELVARAQGQQKLYREKCEDAAWDRALCRPGGLV